MSAQKGALYEDPEFPASAASLGPCKIVQNTEGLAEAVQWLRPGQFEVYADGRCQPFTLFPEDGPSPSDVNQRFLGDCWLLSALSTLASDPPLIQHVFDSPVDSEGEPCLGQIGKYSIKMFDYASKKFVNIIIDDRIPCIPQKDGRVIPMFLRIESGCIWPALLQKATAKFFGSYAAIEGGCSDWPLAAFTGHPAALWCQLDGARGSWQECRTVHVPVKTAFQKHKLSGVKQTANPLSSGLLFHTMRQWLNSEEHQYLIGAGTVGKDEGATDDDGVVPGHAYGILDVIACDGFTLLKLRNPWGRKEWNGAWSDGDKMWEQFPEVAETVEYKPGEDGVFFMSTEDFLTKFNTVFYAKLPLPQDGDEDEEDYGDEADSELEDWYGEAEEEEEGDEDEDEDEDEEEDADIVEEMEKMFDDFDMDGSGTLSKRELIQGLRTHGFKKNVISEIVKIVDANKDGSVTYEEFQEWCLPYLKEQADE